MQLVELPRTFWDKIWLRKAKRELRFYNPLKAKPNSTFRLDTIDGQGKMYQIASIEEYEVVRNGKLFCFTDYNLSFAGETVKLRVVPVPDDRVPDDYSTVMLLLEKDGEEPYSSELAALAMQPTWIIDDDGDDDGDGVAEKAPSHVEYKRLDTNTRPWSAIVRYLPVTVAGNAFLSQEIESRTIAYYDFGRHVEAGGGTTEFEYYFVEVPAVGGIIEMWLGSSILESQVGVV